MQQNADRLRVLLAQEATLSEDLSPAGEPAIRAHLRLVAEALAATAGPATRAGLEELASDAPERFDAGEGAIADDVSLLAEAAARELELQFGDEPTGDDPSIVDMTRRRLRVQAWTRFFLRQVGEAAGDNGFADAALDWMAERQEHLANTIFTMDRRAKEAEIARHGEQAVEDPEYVNRIGQAAMLQAHTRFLVEAVAATLTARRG